MAGLEWGHHLGPLFCPSAQNKSQCWDSTGEIFDSRWVVKLSCINGGKIEVCGVIKRIDWKGHSDVISCLGLSAHVEVDEGAIVEGDGGGLDIDALIDG